MESDQSWAQILGRHMQSWMTRKGKTPDAWSRKELRKLILEERSHARKHPRGQVKGTPSHFHPEKYSKSSPETGVAASRKSKVPVLGGMCVKTGQPQARGVAEGMSILEGVWVPSNPEKLWFLDIH